MYRIHNYNTELPELLDCPFCGGRPIAFRIGNKYTKTNKITIKCTKCFVQRTQASMKGDFSWLENVCINAWNNRQTIK